MNASRRGRFSIPRNWWIDGLHDLIFAALKDKFIVKAESNFMTDRVEYHAYCAEFDLIPEGMEHPTYEILVKWPSKPDEAVKFEGFRRL